MKIIKMKIKLNLIKFIPNCLETAMNKSSIKKIFAYQKDIEESIINGAIACLRAKGYNVADLDLSERRICFLHNGTDIGMNVRWGSGYLRIGEREPIITMHHPKYPVYHSKNKLRIEFKTTLISPVRWLPEDVSAVTEILINKFDLIEDVIANEKTSYNYNNHSTLEHNVNCGYDYNTFLEKIGTPNSAHPDGWNFECWKCGDLYGAIFFLWQEDNYCGNFVPIEQLLSKYKEGQVPCCVNCMFNLTMHRTPVPLD
jgi:hypothetical protein